MKRFWEKVNKTDTCWLWTAARDPLGYGRFWLDGQMRLAHRVAWTLVVGEPTPGLDLDHLCRNRPCVRPDHLEEVTHHVNTLRGEPHQRTHCPRGHELTGKNVYRRRNGTGYICAACVRLKWTPERAEAQRQTRQQQRSKQL